MSDAELPIDGPDTEIRTEAGEAAFGIDETFFSITDSRGVIRAGNEVFRRISEYAWEDLIGAPHKIIRHPDMPRAVFYLMWQRLNAGEPVAAYVKNTTKSGGHYWVIAYITPLADGFLSVRWKPTSQILDQIRGIYSKLRYAELNQSVSPEASMKSMLVELRKQGYRDYPSFMAEALNTEVLRRSEALGERPSLNLPILAEIRQACREIDVLGGEMLRSYKAITVAPTNLQVRASRLGDLGQALASISANFTTLTTEMTAKMNTFSELSDQVLCAVDASRVGIVSKRLIAESVHGFEAEETEMDAQAKVLAVKLFKEEMIGYEDQARGSNDEIKTTLNQFDKIIQEVRQLLSGLSVMRTMSQMEAARLVDEDPSIEMIVNDLRVFHDEALSRLEQIFTLVQSSEKLLQKLFEIARMMDDGALEARSKMSAHDNGAQTAEDAGGELDPKETLENA